MNSIMKLKNIILVSSALLAFSSCDDLFEPAIENQQDLSQMYKDKEFARGILANAYMALPYSSSSVSDVATDDAVSNDNTNAYMKIATGAWSSLNDPTSQWRDRYAAIQYCNIMIENADMVEWATSNEVLNQMYIDNFKGNAYAMRGLQFFYLLRAHSGVTASGELLGAPIHLVPEDGGSNFNVPRDKFADCIAQVFADLDEAEKLLPYEYGNVGQNDAALSKYPGATNAEYNRAFGDHQRGKLDGKIIEAIRAQVALFAASPAYQSAGAATWQQAAEYAAKLLVKMGGISAMQQDGWTWFNNANEIDNLKTGENPAEIIWRDNVGENYDLESDNYPPSIFGKGRINPTQNLVDAFPMANGYPISNAKSGYNPSKPYDGRDPRLAAYVIYNGATIGVDGTEIITGNYSPDNSNGINFENGRSTRTGYYLRKSLRDDVNLAAGKETKMKHYFARIRATEIFLAYAEAANEAGGPTATFGGASFSAKDVIKALRNRAGVGTAYVDECSSKEQMRDLIRNERRLELCFENHRFYDLRRWKAPLNETAKGITITQANADGSIVSSTIDVEARTYKDYMYYSPIPYSEIMKFNNLEQNLGW